MNDPIEPIKRIGDRLREKAQELGLELVQFTLVPDFTDHGNHFVQAVFMLPDDAQAVDDEPEIPDIPALAAIPELDDELAGIMAATADFEQETERQEEEAIRAARQAEEDEVMAEKRDRALALRQKLAAGKDILDD